MAILAASEQSEQAVVTSTLILWRSLGMVLGIAGSSLVVQNGLKVYLNRYITEKAALAAGFIGGKAEVIERVRESVEAVAKLDGEVQEQVISSYEGAVRVTFICCVALEFANVLLLLPIKLPRLGARKK